jgi:type III pantothenate kinase
MTSLCIDKGNTLTKLAIFRNEELIDSRILTAEEHPFITRIIGDYGVEAAILSSVSSLPGSLTEPLMELKTFIILDHTTPLPIENLYETRETLGKDRLAAVVGAHYLYPGEDLLVIDAGTAVTYDVINRQGQYLGGNISPGLQTRFKALNHFTSRLPLLEPLSGIPSLGKNTPGAMRAGVQLGMAFEVDGFIDFFRHSYPDLKVLFTGGDAKYFDSNLKNVIFVVSNLVMIGLNRIILHNAHNK